MANDTLMGVIKQMAVEAVDASSPTSIMFGTVINASPLEINVEQKMVLTKEFLILTHNVVDYDVEMTVNHSTDVTYMDANHAHTASASVTATAKTTLDLKSSKPDTTVTGTAETTVTPSASVTVNGVAIDLSHSHTYTGRKVFRVHNALKSGDNVILLRTQGGQKFIVLDKVV